eukprot:comp5833_c0_seq1/m.1687 comp5833_c0_seq1/g.1687  ORF comp5833_c0_seq1/g.1687 comp5833_c0_seq1/m.1687 type:complete len:207 (-) comp5833_c0_seq1:219-839(-)
MAASTVDDITCFSDQLGANLQEIRKSFAQVVKLTESLQELNRTFGSFLDGMLVAASLTEFPENLAPRIELPPTPEPEPPAEETPPAVEEEPEPAPAPAPPAQNTKPGAKAAPPKGKPLPKIVFPKDKILRGCPAKYQQQPHRKRIELLLDVLKINQLGLAQNDVIEQCSLTRAQCIEYINILAKTSNVLVDNKNGLVYRLHPKHFK